MFHNRWSIAAQGVILIALIVAAGMWLPKLLDASSSRKTALEAVGALAKGDPDEILSRFDESLSPDEVQQLASLVPEKMGSDTRGYYAERTDLIDELNAEIEVRNQADYAFAIVVTLSRNSGSDGWRPISARRLTLE